MDGITTLDAYRIPAARSRQRVLPPTATTFYFDLGSPDTYLAAERANRSFARLRWQPASFGALQAGGLPFDDDARADVARRAKRLGMPLVWPEGPRRTCSPGPMRVASLAAERGRGAEFVIAAGRLIFCGGYDIEADTTILEIAAEAAGIASSDMRLAAADSSRDAAIEDAGRALLQRGADRLPALLVDGTIFSGQDPVDEVATARGDLALAVRRMRTRPVAPAPTAAPLAQARRNLGALRLVSNA